jgi:hypothetical protein
MTLYIEICALIGYYAALSGNSVPTFRDNLSASTSRELLPNNMNKKDGLYLSGSWKLPFASLKEAYAPNSGD